MMLNHQDNGRAVEMNLGDVVTVRLAENPTTGYRWTVETSSGLEPVGDRFEAGGAIGGAGVRELQFRPAQAGTHELCLKNWREWEGDDSVVERFAARIIVK